MGLYNPCSPGSRLGIIAEDLKDGFLKELKDFIFMCFLNQIHMLLKRYWR